MPELLLCPRCDEELYVRHNEAGQVTVPDGVHKVTNVHWQAECHTCQYESPKRSTVWALIEYINRQTQDRPSTEEGDDEPEHYNVG
jgi:hypothetical protein